MGFYTRVYFHHFFQWANLHNILVKKLECYGIRGKSNEWFCSYLANRKQYVEINDKKSITSTITCGVPQGSMLGPLLFIIYINDMHKASSLQCIHYADDTTLFSKGNNLDDLIDLTNNELVKLTNGSVPINFLLILTRQLSLFAPLKPSLTFAE